MPKLAIHLFGAPCVMLDGVELQFARNKSLALLAYLAVTKLPHSRDALAALLWPGYGQQHARDSLRRTLSSLAQELNKEWLVIERATVRLPTSHELAVDVDEFQQLLNKCHTHGHRSEQTCPICVKALEQALTLYRDDFLRGFTLPDSAEFDEWQAFVSESLRNQFDSVLARLSQAAGTQGDHPQAIAYARRRVALNPLNEGAHRQLMQIYWQAGQVTAARQQYQACGQILRQELHCGVSPETEQLYSEITQAATDLPLRSLAPPTPAIPSRTTSDAKLPPHNLPPQSTSFVSRETEINEIITRLLEPSCRLLTILGPGGIGKTRLALQVAQTLLQRERATNGLGSDGVYFISLVGADRADALLSALAGALEFPFERQGELAPQLLRYVSNQRLLLVIDNLEHVLAVTDFLAQLLAAAPQLKVLTTSRAVLNLQEEWLYPLTGLTLPPANNGQTDETLTAYSAIQLFVQRARQVSPRFSLADDAVHVLQVCRLTEGLPLGIELAASWLKTLSCARIANDMAHSLDILSTTLRNVPDRHRSLRAVFEQSWHLLTDPQRTLLKRLAIFRGGFQLAAANAVAGAALLDLVGLIECSLLRSAPTTQGERYDLHELLRQFASAKLGSAPAEQETIQSRHATYYLTWLAQNAGAGAGSQPGATLRAIDVDLDNVRQAWQWAVAQRQATLLGEACDALYGYFQVRGLFGEAQAALEAAIQALSASEETAVIAQALARLQARLGALYFDLGHYQKAIELLEQSQTLAHEQGLRREVAFCLHSLGFIYSKLGDRTAAAHRYQACLALCRQIDDKTRLAEVLRDLTHTVRSEGDVNAAETYAHESLALSRASGEPRQIASVLVSLAMNAYLLGRYDETVRYGQESLAICQAMGDRHGIIRSLMVIGRATRGLGTRQMAEMLPTLLENLALHRAVVSKDTLISILKVICELAIDLGQVQLAYDYALDGLEVARQIDSPYANGEPLRCWGLTALHRGDLITAEQALRQSIRVSGQHGRHPALLDSLHIWAQILLRQGEEGTARRQIKAVEILGLVIHHPATARIDVDLARRLVTQLRAELPAADVDRALSRGQAGSLDEVVREILAV